MNFDLLIRNGILIDGSGQRAEAADLGIEEGLVVARGKLDEAPAGRIIDAAGMIVCPGFIDMHSHSDIALLVSPGHEPKIMQGVTTEVFSSCGLGFAPVTHQALQTQRELIMSLFGDESGLDWNWHSVAEYLRKFHGRTSVNIVYQVPHGALRLCVMDMKSGPASDEELESMKRLLRESLDAGAFGMSSGLVYAPMCYSDLRESVELCKVVAEYDGIYSIHVRDYQDRMLESVDESLEIARRSGVSLQESHYLCSGSMNWGKSALLLERLSRARDEGLNVHCDSYPYTAGSTCLHSYLPRWASQGGRAATLARLANKEMRANIVLDIGRDPTDWSRAELCYVASGGNKSLEGRNIGEVAKERKQAAAEFICDLLLEEELEVVFVYHDGNESDVQAIMSYPFHMAGSDGVHVKGRPHPRLYGTFPRYLGKYARELKILDWETAIRKMTGLPAEKLGLKDRGVLAVGKAADVVIFDPNTVRDLATYSDPCRYPEGIPFVVVNGAIVKDSGQHTQERAGRVLHR